MNHHMSSSNYIARSSLSCLMVLISSLCLTNCSQPASSSTMDYQGELENLFIQEKRLFCKLESMKDMIHSRWDNMNNVLEANFPSEMPQKERENMLSSRNASLIRMFDSYDHMDESVHQSLDDLENYDMSMSRTIVAIKDSINQLATQRMDYYKKLAEDTAKLKAMDSMHKKILESDCTTL